jgi:hypothetical protein
MTDVVIMIWRRITTYRQVYRSHERCKDKPYGTPKVKSYTIFDP